MPSAIHSRFRTAHEAGKYIAAQLYPEARGLNAEEFGAVPRYQENPGWHVAPFEVTQIPDGMEESGWRWEMRDRFPEEVKTSRDWYNEYASKGITIIIASGWDDINPENFDEFFHYTPITRTEFLIRVKNSVIEQYTK